jgi:hemerythrin-like domain-containing protein
MEGEIAKFLRRDHRNLDEMFDRFREYKQLNDLAKAKEYFIRFKCDLTRHMELEEEILFKFYELRSGKRDQGWTAAIRQEHEELRGIIQNIFSEIKQGNLDFDELESEFVEIFKNHNDHEEDVLYSAIDVVITEEEKKDLFAKMRAFPKECCRECFRG